MGVRTILVLGVATCPRPSRGGPRRRRCRRRDGDGRRERSPVVQRPRRHRGPRSAARRRLRLCASRSVRARRHRLPRARRGVRRSRVRLLGAAAHRRQAGLGQQSDLLEERLLERRWHALREHPQRAGRGRHHRRRHRCDRSRERAVRRRRLVRSCGSRRVLRVRQREPCPPSVRRHDRRQHRDQDAARAPRHGRRLGRLDRSQRPLHAAQLRRRAPRLGPRDRHDLRRHRSGEFRCRLGRPLARWQLPDRRRLQQPGVPALVVRDRSRPSNSSRATA